MHYGWASRFGVTDTQDDDGMTGLLTLAEVTSSHPAILGGKMIDLDTPTDAGAVSLVQVQLTPIFIGLIP